MIDIRVGQGVDVHPFAERRPLILGGVRISDTGGLDGYSDADAVIHAVVDAILGALGEGDIGQYFPSDDPRWKNADSAIFVKEAMALLSGRAAELRNVDITIIAQKPRLSPHRHRIRGSMASLLGLDRSRVNVKATTTDQLGFIGREEGLCAMAVVSIVLPPF